MKKYSPFVVIFAGLNSDKIFSNIIKIQTSTFIFSAFPLFSSRGTISHILGRGIFEVREIRAFYHTVLPGNFLTNRVSHFRTFFRMFDQGSSL